VVAKFGERYELIERIGAGGMGEVWLAHDEQLAGRPVAIKIMHKHMLPNEDDVARFEREMRFAAMMDHPNIVTVYTTGTWDDAPFMVMEYLRGHDLEQVLPGDDAELIAGIGRDVCRGLAYAHREGVIHRDIKPANLFLCESGQVKIADFGVARAVDGTTLSTIGVIVGTLAFLPPERWRGEPPAFSNDIWAVGCVLYRLISGRLPRVLPDVAGYAAAATRGDSIPDLRDITDAPGWLTGPVMAMLADDPASRPTAGECVQLLSSAQFPPPVSGRPARTRHLPGLVSSGLVGLGLLGSGHAEPAPAAGATEDPVAAGATEDPVAALATRPDASRPAAHRPWRPGRGALAVAGLLVLLLAGLVTAWRLSGTASGRGLAASSAATTTAAAGQAAAATPVATAGSASRSTSAAAATPHSTAAVAPGTSPSVTRASSHPTSTAASTTAPPSASHPASPSASPPASSAPPLVPIPDVVGMTFTNARLLLVSDGFKVVGRHTRVGQVVTRTNPSSGEVPAGSVIIVVYGRGALLLRPAPSSRSHGQPVRCLLRPVPRR
jgi:serine/threonine-protein kinase